MAIPATGSVVLISFPFSDLSSSKLRPALVLAHIGHDDLILCQLTSKPYDDPNAIPILSENYSSGSLPITSYARPGKLFTASNSLISGTIATVSPKILQTVIDTLISILSDKPKHT